jgi:hypothetical protein
LILFEYSVHGTGHSYRILFFHAAHDHTEVLRFDDDGNSAGVNFLIDRFRDLRGQPFLNLQTSGEHVNQPRNFAQADHAPVRYVPDVAFTEKRKQVMFAQTEKLNVPDDDHLVIRDIEQRPVNQLVYIHLVAAGQETESAVDAGGRVHQAITLGILAKLCQD